MASPTSPGTRLGGACRVSHRARIEAWSLAVARFDQRGFVTAIARTALQLLPDFQAQGAP